MIRKTLVGVALCAACLSGAAFAQNPATLITKAEVEKATGVTFKDGWAPMKEQVQFEQAGGDLQVSLEVEPREAGATVRTWAATMKKMQPSLAVARRLVLRDRANRGRRVRESRLRVQHRLLPQLGDVLLHLRLRFRDNFLDAAGVDTATSRTDPSPRLGNGNSFSVEKVCSFGATRMVRVDGRPWNGWRRSAPSSQSRRRRCRRPRGSGGARSPHRGRRASICAESPPCEACLLPTSIPANQKPRNLALREERK